MQGTLDAPELNRLRWRCRRGLLENDLLIERFFARHAAHLTESQAQGLQALMELPDPDLLDLLLARREPESGEVSACARAVLSLMRTQPATEEMP